MNAAAAVVVVGASVLAGALIAQLRADGFTGRIVVADQDPGNAPQDRPPFSEEFLARNHGVPDAHLRELRGRRPSARWKAHCSGGPAAGRALRTSGCQTRSAG